MLLSMIGVLIIRNFTMNQPRKLLLKKDVEEEQFIVEKRKLDAINQFARAMPLLFEGVSTM